MNQNNLGKLTVVALVLLWSFYQINPPVGKKLGEVFQEEAIPKFKDADYTNIVQRFEKLQQDYPGRTDYANLTEAIGTNDFSRYYPNLVDAKAELNPTRAVLTRLQTKAAGKIKLGIDLQGGTSFLVKADYSKLEGDTNAAAGATNTATNGTNTTTASTNAVVSDAVKKVALSQ